MFSIESFCENLKKIRTAKGYSQHGLAAKLNVSPQTVSKWECGRGVPDIENLCLLASVLGVSLDAIIGNTANRRRLMIGIDGGGSKTEFLLFSEDGEILGRAMRGGCSPTIIGIEACADLLCEGIGELLAVQSGVCAIFVGCAGFYTDHNGDKVKKLLKKCYPHIRIECRSDIANVIRVASCEKSVIAAICGTGVSVFISDEDRLSLFTGWGYMLDRFGSGYTIGRDALTAALEASVGLGPKTALLDCVEERLGMPIGDAVGEIYRRGVSGVAAFSSSVFRAHERGDAVARQILETNAAHFAHLIAEAAKHCPVARTVIISGGLIGNNPIYASMVREKVNPALAMITDHQPQSIGACLLAADLADAKDPALRDALILSYQKEYGE